MHDPGEHDEPGPGSNTVGRVIDLAELVEEEGNEGR
jgi:hypothetical protein